MNSINFLLEIQQQMNEAFVSQDLELLDVVFEIEGKKLYADKLRLSVISSTFKSMLSDRWNTKNKNEPIKVEAYKFNNFKEFLIFIYSGECKITDSNVYDLLDMSEFYQIKHLNELCDGYLSKMEYNLGNICELMETSIRYSLIHVKQLIQAFISENFIKLIKCEQFLNANKLFIKEMIVLEFITKPEENFQAVYEWSEHQAIKTQKESDDKSFDMNDAIKAGMAPFLQYFQLKKMEKSFLNSYVAERSFIFSNDQFSSILTLVNSEVRVKITNNVGVSIFASFPYNFDVVELIKSLKNRPSDNSGFNQIMWYTENITFPFRTLSLKKRDGVKFYLIFYYDGDFGVRSSSDIEDGNYILAEMITDKWFFVTPECKIKIY